MPLRTSEAVWEGNLKAGKGTMTVGQGAYEGPYSFMSRFEEGTGTNPEELVAAAHAGCYSMALSNGLDKAGFTPTRVHTQAKVHLTLAPKGGFHISRIDLHVDAVVPGISEETFQEEAETAKANCPVSKALAATEITLVIESLTT